MSHNLLNFISDTTKNKWRNYKKKAILRNTRIYVDNFQLREKPRPTSKKFVQLHEPLPKLWY